MKRFFVLCLVVLGFLLGATPLLGAQVSIVFDGKPLVSDVEPEIDAATWRTMVPYRAIFEALGYRVDYSAPKKIVSAERGKDTMSLQIGNLKATVNGVVKTMDLAPYIKSDRTMVPLRFVSENSGASVYWESSNRTAYIYSDGRPVEDDQGGFTGTAPQGLLTGTILWQLGGGLGSYSGNLSAGRYAGQGIFTTALGGVYNGGWNQGNLAGQGRYTYPNGEYFTGTLDKGSFVQGTYHYADGSSYSGAWSGDRPHGQGTYTYPDGRTVTGAWNNGAVILNRTTQTNPN